MHTYSVGHSCPGVLSWTPTRERVTRKGGRRRARAEDADEDATRRTHAKTTVVSIVGSGLYPNSMLRLMGLRAGTTTTAARAMSSRPNSAPLQAAEMPVRLRAPTPNPRYTQDVWHCCLFCRDICGRRKKGQREKDRERASEGAGLRRRRAWVDKGSKRRDAANTE